MANAAPVAPDPLDGIDTGSLIRSFGAASDLEVHDTKFKEIGSSPTAANRWLRRRALTDEEKLAKKFAKAALALRELHTALPAAAQPPQAAPPVPLAPPPEPPHQVVPLVPIVEVQPTAATGWQALRFASSQLLAKLQPRLQLLGTHWGQSYTRVLVVILITLLRHIPTALDCAILFGVLTFLYCLALRPELAVTLFVKTLKAVPAYASFASHRMTTQLWHEITGEAIPTQVPADPAPLDSTPRPAINVTVVQPEAESRFVDLSHGASALAGAVCATLAVLRRPHHR